MDNLATVALQLLKDAIHLSPAEEPDGESLSQRVFMALTPSEHQLNFLRNEYSKVISYTDRTYGTLRYTPCEFGRAVVLILTRLSGATENPLRYL